MAPRLQWATELVAEEFIVPRLEDHLIDELFYQEDEIGEMRHTAFMVECGLEEDPPDGPDVPPVPWGDMLLKQQQQQQQENRSNKSKAIVEETDSDGDDGLVPNRKGKRGLPNRSRSTDDIDTLAIELTSGRRIVKKRPPVRSSSTPADSLIQLSPTSPGGLPDRKPPRRVPTKVSPESPPKRKAPVRGGLTKTRSGTTHEMASAAARARKKMDQEAGIGSSPKQPPAYRKLTKTQSGTCHEVANAAARYRQKLNAEKEKSENAPLTPIKSPSVAERRKSIESMTHKHENKGRPVPLVRGLVATKSGTKHVKATRKKEDSNASGNEDIPTPNHGGASPKIVYKNGKRTAERTRSSVSKDSHRKSKSSTGSIANGDSTSGKKKEKISYRNGRDASSISQHSTFSESSIDRDEFLGDIIQDSDDDSVAKSVISISTVGSDIEEIVISPRRKEHKFAVPKPPTQELKMPARQMSVTSKDAVSLSDDNLSEDFVKKKKKKNKKKDSHGDSLHDSFQSTKSKKKKKKKELRTSDYETRRSNDSIYSPRTRSKKQIESLGSSDDDTRDRSRDSKYSPRQGSKKYAESLGSSDDDTNEKPYVSIYSPRQTSTKQSESTYGTCYPSPSSIRSQNRKKLASNKASSDDTSSPAIVKIGSPGGFYRSPSAIKAENRKRLSPTEKSMPFVTPIQSPSTVESSKHHQDLRSRSDDFVCTDPLAAIKKKRAEEKTAALSPSTSTPSSSSARTFRVTNRPDDWLGSGKKAQRTWRVKPKPTD